MTAPLDADAPGLPRSHDAVARRRPLAPWIALILALIFGALFVVLAGSDADSDDQVDTFLIDKPAPQIVSTTLDEQPFELSRRKGSWVLLNFFDPSCIPCRQEHPELVVLAAQQDALGIDGAELYTIINRGSDADVREYFDTYGGDWPVVRDAVGTISVSFGVAQVPETWVIDPNGIVRARFAGKVTAEGVGSLLQQFREGSR